MQHAIEYLLSDEARNPDGTWGEGDRQLLETVAALRALRETQQAGLFEDNGEILRLRTYFSAVLAPDTQRLNQVLVGQIVAGVNAAATRTALLDAQNPDGGWALTADKQSNPTDTVTVLDALLGVEDLSIPLPVHTTARDYLIAGQDVEGAWRIGGESAPSDIPRSASALLALRLLARMDTSAGLRQARDRASDFLDDQLDAEMSAAARALVIRALAGVRQPADLQEGLGELISSQMPEGAAGAGSWDGDVVTTALAIRAILSLRPPDQPDLPDLQILFAAYDAAASGIRVTVVNSGPVETGAQTVDVGLYTADPRFGGVLLEELTVPVMPAGGAATVTFDPPRFAEGVDMMQIVVVADPDNDIAESDEANNSASIQVDRADTPVNLAVRPSSLVVELAGCDGQTCDVTLRAFIANYGATDQVSANITFSITPQGGPSDPYQEQRTLTGDVTEVSKTLTDYTLATGLHTFTFAINSPGSASASIEFEYEGTQADLAIGHVKFFDSAQQEVTNPTPGEIFTLKVLVQNVGTGSAPSSTLVVTPGDPRLWQGEPPASAAVPSIEAERSSEVTIDPYRVPLGTIVDVAGVQTWRTTIGTWVDSDEEVSEPNEYNNVALETTDGQAITPMPDLAVIRSSIVVSHLTLEDNPTVRVSASACNIGAVAISGVRVVFEWPNPTTGLIEPLGTAQVGSLDPGESVRASALWFPDVGSQTVVARIEADGPELTLANNDASHSFDFVRDELPIELLRPGTTAEWVVSTDDDPTTGYNWDYAAYETASIRLLQGQLPSEQFYAVEIEYPDGSITPLSSGSVQSRYDFFTDGATVPPGTYMLSAELREATSPTESRVLARAEASIEVIATQAIETVTAVIDPDLVVIGPGFPDPPGQSVKVQLTNRSNVPLDLRLVLGVTPPTGPPLPGSALPAPLEVHLEPTDTLRLFDITSSGLWDYPFSIAGLYSVSATAELVSSGSPVSSGTSSFFVGEQIDLSFVRTVRALTQPSLSPEEDVLAPRDGERVEVTITVVRPQ